MKAVKLGIFAMAMGLFVASCGSTETTEEAPATEVTTETTTETTSEVVPGTDSVVETTTVTETVDTAVQN